MFSNQPPSKTTSTSISAYTYTHSAIHTRTQLTNQQARELSWLLESLQETLVSLKSGLEECYALLAPIEPGSTLVMSSPRSESVKGHVTRVGTRIVKGVCIALFPFLFYLSFAPKQVPYFTLPCLASVPSLPYTLNHVVLFI